MSITSERLNELIDNCELSRKQLAEELGCDVSTIAKHYNGDRKISSEFIVKYAVFFHVSTDYLLGNEAKQSDYQKHCQAAEYTRLNPLVINVLRSADDKTLYIINQVIWLFRKEQE